MTKLIRLGNDEYLHTEEVEDWLWEYIHHTNMKEEFDRYYRDYIAPYPEYSNVPDSDVWDDLYRDILDGVLRDNTGDEMGRYSLSSEDETHLIEYMQEENDADDRE